ncbi:MAG: histidine phosphatase family protein [Calditrichaceae bacterium]|jgi:phosphohistidine phosphatase
MKSLLLVRHAKSSWQYPGLTDFERPLNKRGHRDAPFMGELLLKRNAVPDLIISSPATRAITTARYFAENMKYSLEKIRTDERLYDASVNDITKVIYETDNTVESLMIVSHNPGLTETADRLSGKIFENIVTSAVMAIQFDAESWDKINSKNADVEFYEYPKKYA